MMIRVVDVSKAQGPIDFARMRLLGVQGLIIRLCHGMTLDTMVDTYYPAALAAGYRPRDIGLYAFINPKRGSAADTARFAASEIRRITGSSAYFYMLDVENYRDQSPDVGQAPLVGAGFSDYIAEHTDVFRNEAPDTVVIGYSNQAFWNSAMGPNDHVLAAEYEWIVARYPVNSTLGYAAHPLPAPIGWEDWAFARAPDGPHPPVGGTWKAWQFSAGYNRQGSRYGASSGDLDLNIVYPEAWLRWTSRVIPNPPPMEADMPAFISNKFAGKYGAAPSPQGGCTIWERVLGTKRALGFEDWVGYGQPYGVACDDATLDGIPDYVPAPPVVIPPIPAPTIPPLKFSGSLGANGVITGGIDAE